MLNREEVRKILVARDIVIQRYKDTNREEFTIKELTEDILKEIQLIDRKSKK